MSGGEWREFGHGAATYPLDDAAPNTEPLLQRADPALWMALQFLPFVLDAEIGDAWAAYAALAGFPNQQIINTTASVEPVPALYSDRIRFPFFTIYRKSETLLPHTVAYDKSVSVWEYAYVLPALMPKQQEKLAPILRTVVRVIARFLRRGWHPDFQSGAPVLLNAGVMSSRLVDAKYDRYAPLVAEPKANDEQFHRAVLGSIEVVERDMPVEDAFPTMSGASVSVGLQHSDGTVVEDVAVAELGPAPTITSITPNSGTKLGNTPISIVGTNFASPMRLNIGGIDVPTSVVSSTLMTATTPPHDAYPTYMADVIATNLQGQSARVSAGFTFTSP